MLKHQQKTLKHTVGRRPKPSKPGKSTRIAILDAARRVFAQKGLDGTSVREVAGAARVNNAMIYYHFKDKDDLYRSVLSDSFSAMTDIWSDPIFTSKTSVRHKIERYVESFIRFQKGNEELRRIMAMEFAASGGNITWICEKYFADNFARLSRIFREGIRTGELTKINPPVAVASLIGVVVHNFIMQPMAAHIHGRAVDLSPKKFGSFVTELFFNGLSSKAGKRKR